MGTSTSLGFHGVCVHVDGPLDAKLETERFLLRPLSLEDAPTVARLAGRRGRNSLTLSAGG